MLVQERKTIETLYLIHGFKKNTVFSECARDLVPLSRRFLYAVQDVQCKTEESPG